MENLSDILSLLLAVVVIGLYIYLQRKGLTTGG